MSTLSKFIQVQRKRRRMTQEYLASEIGVSRPTYIKIERGKRDPTISELRRIASAFGMPLENLLSTSDNFLMINEQERSVPVKRASGKKRSGLHIRVTEENLEKFQQVLLYVLSKVGGKPNVGEAVLHTLLYFIDFDYYEKFEENLMGAGYIKSHCGPTSVELEPVLQEMQEQGEVEAVRSAFFKHRQKKYLPRVRSNLAVLSAREIAHIDAVLARLCDKNVKEIERYARGDIPWKSARDGERISYESVFYRDEHYSVRNYDDDL